MFYERDYGHELFIFNVTLDCFMYLVFDTETTGLPRNWSAPLSDSENWPRCVQIAWQLHASDGTLLSHENYLVKPIGFDIPFESEKVHGISTALASKDGLEIESVIESFLVAIDQVLTNWSPFDQQASRCHGIESLGSRISRAFSSKKF